MCPADAREPLQALPPAAPERAAQPLAPHPSGWEAVRGRLLGGRPLTTFESKEEWRRSIGEGAPAPPHGGLRRRTPRQRGRGVKPIRCVGVGANTLSESTREPESKALDVIVGLLPELDDEFESSGTRFFDRLCEAVCRLVSLERAGLVLYDEARRLVVPVGSHGIDPRRPLADLRHARRDAHGADGSSRGQGRGDLRKPRRAPAGALRAVRRSYDLGLHARLRRRALARCHLRRQRWRALFG